MVSINLSLQFLTIFFLFSNILFISGCKKTEVTEGLQGVTVSNETLTISIGNSQQVFSSVYPHIPGNDQIIWSVENPSIATIEDKGTNNGVSNAIITAMAKGEVEIIAESKTDRNKKATITVSVVDYTFEDLAKGMDYMSD